MVGNIEFKKEKHMLKTIEQWAEEKFPFAITLQDLIKNKRWLFESAKQLHRWPSGLELTEEEFDEAISIAEGHHVI